MLDPRAVDWRDFDVEPILSVCSAFAKHPSLRHSFFFVKDPARCVREEYAKQKADGALVDLFAGKSLNVATNGNASSFIRQPKFETDGWYGLRTKGRGEVVRGSVYFQYNGSWRWSLGAVRFDFDKADAEGWRDGVALVRIPDGANNLYVLLDAGKDEKVRKVEFKGLEIFRIK